MRPLIELERVSKSYSRRGPGKGATVQAVDSVSLAIHPGEALALVGESGCGKSTTARLLLNLESPDEGRRVTENQEEPPLVRAVFQNPRSSLNPRRRVGSLISEAFSADQKKLPKADRMDLIRDTLVEVGLAEEHADSYPHALSGGQQQRVAIAAAIVARPKLIVLDEPVSALDVSIAAQVLNLLVRIQADRQCAYLFITHDLAMARIVAHRIAVMYLGRVIETGDTSAVLGDPAHHYTRALLDAEPAHHPSLRAQAGLQYLDVPSPSDRPNGCAYHPRCPQNDANRCPTMVPPLEAQGSGQRLAACFYPLSSQDDGSFAPSADGRPSGSAD